MDQKLDFPDGICPIMSTPEKKVPCTEECQLYRKGKKGFACAFHDLAIIAWNLKPENRRQK